MVVYSRNGPLLCITFTSSLKGMASDWFYSLSPRSLHNFKEVTETFLTQYASRREAKRNNHHLLSVKIGRAIISNHTSASSKANSPRSPTTVRTSLHFIHQRAAKLPPPVQTPKGQCHSDEQGPVTSSALHLAGKGNENFLTTKHGNDGGKSDVEQYENG